jgi:CBS domain-containing protein
VNVREAIVPDPRVVQASAGIREAAELLTHPNVRSVLVVDGERLVGSVTPESIVAALARGVDLTTATAGDAADGNVTVVGPDAPVDEALRLMSAQDLERIAVVEDDRFLGVLPRGPLLRRLAEDEPDSPEPDAVKRSADAGEGSLAD